MGDAGNFPAAGPGVRGAEELFERKLVVVAHHEVVFYIEGRKRFAERGIKWVDGFAEVRRLFRRFAESVPGEHGEASAGVAQSDLQRVVIGISDGRLISIAAKIRAKRPGRAGEDLPCGAGVLGVLAERAAGSLSRREIGRIAQK